MPRQPPVTPSPHRFLAGKQRSPPPPRNTKPGSDSRKDAPQLSAPKIKASPRSENSSQFAVTPRFSFGKTKPTTQELRSPSPPKPAAIQSFRAHAKPIDQVEDAGDGNEDDQMLDVDQSYALPTTEEDPEQQWTKDVAFSPKRRRLDESSAALSPARPTFKYPGAPASEATRATPHFTFLGHQPSQASTLSVAPHFHRPAFIRPSTEPQEQHEPLPETFSPHKRGQKFVPGGMAATMQQWVIETGQAAVQSRKGQGYLRGEDYVMRAKVESFNGDGTFTAHATSPSGDVIHLMLTANCRSNSGQTQEVTEGCVVGVRAPTWELEIDGRVWTVAVDWKVIS